MSKISRHSNDIILKATAEAFRGQTLEAIGLNLPPIVDMLPTVLPVAEVREERIDFNVYLNRMDGEKEYEHLKEKIRRGEELSGSELVRLIFLPLMRHKEKEGEVALKAAELAKEIKNERQNLVFAAIIALSDKYMSESEKKRLLEVVAMTQIEQWIREEGRKEGIAIGMEKGEREKALATARAALKKGFSPEDIAEITGLPLDEVLAIKQEIEN